MLLDSISAKTIHLGLDRIRMVLEVLSFSPNCPIVTVGGTNGKGSTVFLTSRFLESAGYKVGTYTSPHLHTVHERIAVNQQLISEDDLTRLLEFLDTVLKKNTISLTYFEVLTVVALLYFKEQGCTQIVLEVGMGGRLDAVNVVDPTVAVLTTLSIDHKEWLGDTLEAIAVEKSGIARAGYPVLVGIGAQNPALQMALEGIGAQVEYENQDFCCSSSETGSFLPTHVALAVRACECVMGHSFETIPDFQGWIWPGRFERYQAYGTDWILDVAHNQESVYLLADKLKKIQTQYPGIIAVWHSLADKELDVIVQTMRPIVEHWVLAPIENDRATPLEVLRDTVIRYGGRVEPSITPYTEQGYLIVVFGGFNIVADFKRLLK
jgi:dihydrofolate synthase / folylpolyglutamate synthase